MATNHPRYRYNHAPAGTPQDRAARAYAAELIAAERGVGLSAWDVFDRAADTAARLAAHMLAPPTSPVTTARARLAARAYVHLLDRRCLVEHLARR